MYNGEVWCKCVREREAINKHAIRWDGAPPLVDAWVYGELEGDTNDAEDGHGDPNLSRWQAKTTSESEQSMWVVGIWELRWWGGRVIPVSREEDEPEVIEGADMKRCSEVCEQRKEHIRGPDTTEGQLFELFRFRFRCLNSLRLGIFLDIFDPIIVGM